jgi:hypothetical protein
VLRGWLGLSDADIAALLARGILTRDEERAG